jgi:phage terminase small subunit
MPRQSAAAGVFPLAHASPPLPQPSPDLAPEAAGVFRELVAAAPCRHFRVSDAPVIEAYCTAVAQARQAERELQTGGPVTATGRVSPWVRIRNDAAKTIASLSMRLRLCPQARLSSRDVGRHPPPSRPRPWE